MPEQDERCGQPWAMLVYLAIIAVALLAEWWL
jgi:hypothetical protein